MVNQPPPSLHAGLKGEMVSLSSLKTIVSDWRYWLLAAAVLLHLAMMG